MHDEIEKESFATSDPKRPNVSNLIGGSGRNGVLLAEGPNGGTWRGQAYLLPQFCEKRKRGQTIDYAGGSPPSHRKPERCPVADDVAGSGGGKVGANDRQSVPSTYVRLSAAEHQRRDVRIRGGTVVERDQIRIAILGGAEPVRDL